MYYNYSWRSIIRMFKNISINQTKGCKPMLLISTNLQCNNSNCSIIWTQVWQHKFSDNLASTVLHILKRFSSITGPLVPPRIHQGSALPSLVCPLFLPRWLDFIVNDSHSFLASVCSFSLSFPEWDKRLEPEQRRRVKITVALKVINYSSGQDSPWSLILSSAVLMKEIKRVNLVDERPGYGGYKSLNCRLGAWQSAHLDGCHVTWLYFLNALASPFCNCFIS